MATLYMVASPIGNLKDITFRAVDTLRNVDAIACEDTRHSLRLLNAYEIRKPLISCRSQNESSAAVKVIDRMKKGEDIAYLSDAGSPGVSDPGAVLIRLVREEGFDVVPLPGPSALAALVSVSPFGGRTVTFDGFQSPKQGRRRKRLKELMEREENFVLYESPFRIVKLLTDIADIESDREVLVGREMTKTFEEFLFGPASEVLRQLSERNSIKGEFSVLVSGKKKS